MKDSAFLSAINHFSGTGGISFQPLTIQDTIILCGAGISTESHLPLGGTLTDTLLAWFGFGKDSNSELKASWFKSYNEDVVSKILGARVNLYDCPRLEILFDCLKGALPDSYYQKTIKSLLLYDYWNNRFPDCIYSNYHHYTLARFLLDGGTVLTANFDPLVEHAAAMLDPDRSFNRIVFPLAEKPVLLPGQGTLVKYHGDLDRISTIGIDVSHLSIDGFHDAEAKLLDEVFRPVRNLVFVGFSMSDTLDLIPFLKTRKSLNYFFLNYLKDGKNEIRRIRPAGREDLMAYEYILRQFDAAYVIDNVGNAIQHAVCPFPEDSPRVPAIEIAPGEKDELEKVRAELSDARSTWNRTVRFNILKTLGLMNYANEAELTGLPLEDRFKNYLRNINGDYRYNYEHRDRKSLTQSFFRKLEYVFLQEGQWFGRSLAFLTLPASYGRIRWRMLTHKEDMEALRMASLFQLRVLQTSVHFHLDSLVPRFCLKRLLKKMNTQIAWAKECKDLPTYRYACKERLYLEGMFHLRPNTELKQNLKDLFELNIDSNYYVEANNLLRFGCLTLKERDFQKAAVQSARMTKDHLNEMKLQGCDNAEQ